MGTEMGKRGREPESGGGGAGERRAQQVARSTLGTVLLRGPVVRLLRSADRIVQQRLRHSTRTGGLTRYQSVRNSLSRALSWRMTSQYEVGEELLVAKERATYRLRFTNVSTCAHAEFMRRCGDHDFWYHSFYFDNGYEQRGDYDIGRDVADYNFPEDMTGMEVLDVGTGSGWFATYFEQRGAKVTTVDARGYCDFDVFGRSAYPDVTTEKPSPDRILPDGRVIYYSPVSRGFWVMKDILGLKAEYVNARIYDICPELFDGRKFDLVFVGSVLMHLRDPIGALMAVRSVCRSRLIANSLRLPDRDGERTPYMLLVSSDEDKITWWVPNKACLMQWFRAAGFSKIDAERTVNLTVDKPFVDASGRSSAANQTLHLVDAQV
jgi:tRNA (mo5U34)-methyltransferase